MLQLLAVDLPGGSTEWALADVRGNRPQGRAKLSNRLASSAGCCRWRACAGLTCTWTSDKQRRSRLSRAQASRSAPTLIGREVALHVRAAVHW